MSVESDPDAALMLRVREGDRDAFTELVEKYRRPVVNLLYHTVRDLDEAEDLAQNVFVQVFKSAHRYEVTARFSTWLFTIARNLGLNEIRRRVRHPAESLDEPWSGEEDSPARELPDTRTAGVADSLLRGELEAKVAEAIGALPENQRTALLLCREEELSYEEIAGVLGVSVSATKSLIFRGREFLKQKLKPYLSTGDWT